MPYKFIPMNSCAKTLASCRAASKEQGATLIEVLVAVLILSFGLLGMAALQTRALQGSQSSAQRSQASMLGHYMMDAMRIDRESAKAGNYNMNFICDPNTISGNSLNANNRKDWLSTARTSLGVSADSTTCGKITCNDSYVCKVEVQWDDSRVSGGLGTQTIVIESKI
jgi:type IV pilus assembly protein PilV